MDTVPDSGVMKDEEVKFEESEGSHTLGGSPYDGSGPPTTLDLTHVTLSQPLGVGVDSLVHSFDP